MALPFSNASPWRRLLWHLDGDEAAVDAEDAVTGAGASPEALGEWSGSGSANSGTGRSKLSEKSLRA